MIEVPRTTTGAPTLDALGLAFVRFVDAVRAAVNPALKKPILDGVLLTGVSLNGVTLVSHGLGRSPQGWVVVSQSTNGGGSVCEPDKSTRSSTVLYLNGSGGMGTPVLVDLWVF